VQSEDGVILVEHAFWWWDGKWSCGDCHLAFGTANIELPECTLPRQAILDRSKPKTVSLTAMKLPKQKKVAL
jgi:hypothetical protein